MARFETTHWSLVLDAAREGEPAGNEALARLCETYWYPLYAYARHLGCGPDDAADITQGYLASLIEKRWLSDVNQDRGRFREFLRASLRHYLSGTRRHARAQKRRPRELISIDGAAAAERFRLEPQDLETPEAVFERLWARALVERVLERLRSAEAGAGRGERYEVLVQHLKGLGPLPSQRETAQQLGISEGAAKVALHRLRQHFGELLRQEIERTVADPTLVQDELREILLKL